MWAHRRFSPGYALSKTLNVFCEENKVTFLHHLDIEVSIQYYLVSTFCAHIPLDRTQPQYLLDMKLEIIEDFL